MRIVNCSKSEIGVPGIGSMAPGASEPAPEDWTDIVDRNPVVAAWIRARLLLVVSEPVDAPEPEPEIVPEPVEDDPVEHAEGRPWWKRSGDDAQQ